MISNFAMVKLLKLSKVSVKTEYEPRENDHVIKNGVGDDGIAN